MNRKIRILKERLTKEGASEGIERRKEDGKKKKTILHRVERPYIHAAHPADPLKSIAFRLVGRNAISAA